MTTSIIDLQRDIILRTLAQVAVDESDNDDYKELICDQDSRIILDNVASEDEVFSTHVTGISQLEDRRQTQTDTKAAYFLSPLPHIVEWLRIDLRRRRYKQAYVIWTSRLRPDLREQLNQDRGKTLPIVKTWDLDVDYFPQESHLITFREKWSSQVLFNRHCDELIRDHFESITKKIISVCASLGEYPLVRYYRPRNAIHEAAVLCTHLAKFVQDGIDGYARQNADFPPQSSRPRATLLITDRSMDLMAPIVHELTYQAMAMDLLQTQDHPDGKITYRNVIRRGTPEEKTEDVPLNDKDKIWVENRHLLMKDLLLKLSDDFKKFQAKNPQFANNDAQNVSVNTIKDMLAGLPEFQQGKDAFSLHIDMADKCAKLFETQKLLDVTSLEQSFATGLDEDNKPPKNTTDQLVRLLADESVNPDNRARLLMMYIIYRNGILNGDIDKLLCHGELPIVYRKMIDNLQHLGAPVKRGLKDPVVPYQPLYPSKEMSNTSDEISLSRFEPMLRLALEELCQGRLDGNKFPPTKPHLDKPDFQAAATQTSLRSAGKPTWANTRPSANKPRQRIIVFIAGGATYSESRVCYEVSQQMGKEIFLATTHLLTPKQFLRDISDLDEPRRNLDLPGNTIPKPPEWLNDPPPGAARPIQQPQAPSKPVPPTQAMQNMNLGPSRPQNGPRPTSSQTPTPPNTAGSFSTKVDHSSGKLKKEKKESKFGGLFRKH